MGLFNIFTGKSSADYERTGDALARDNAWGEAKLAFEAALDKLAKQSPADPAMSDRLRVKLQRSKEALAMVQRQEALELIDAGCMVEARELLGLAIELTADPQLKEELAQQIHETTLLDRPAGQGAPTGFLTPPDDPEADLIIEDTDEHFNVLLGALPDEIQQAYRGYGHHFKLGYLALNQGEFDQAVTHLLQAAEENRSPKSLVPLELATAYVNLGQAATARALLEELIQHRADLLPAFQLLCEIYWEDKDFDQAIRLLETLAPELAQSMGACMLKGETFLKAGRSDEAKSFFQDLIEKYGWNETIALGLAKAYEALGQTTQARDVYGELIAQCSGCGTWIDPSIKRKYADLSFASGQYTTKVLEYYLALSQQDPDNAHQYCKNISRIYLALGNHSESQRFQSIADELARRQNMTTL